MHSKISLSPNSVARTTCTFTNQQMQNIHSSPSPESFAGNLGEKRISDLWCLVEAQVVTTTGKIPERIMAIQKIQI